MVKKILSFVLVIWLIFSLCGCDLLTAETTELIYPPELTGAAYPIAEAINNSVKGEYTFKYPSRGDYRSAVVQEDIDSDGILEAFAFYSMTDGETITMNINAICNNSGKWQSVGQQKIVAGGVDRIDFCDLDGDGVKEILVGWEVYGTSELQLAVYSITRDAITQRMLQKYTHFITCDLDENNLNEVLIIKVAVSEQINSAALYSFSNEGITEIASCQLDGAAKAASHPIVATLSTGKPAVYIDEIKGVGAVTEVLYIEKGALVNPLMQQDIGETVSTLRSVTFSTEDINNDSIPEIPVQENVPTVARSEVNEKLYLTNWCSYNGELLTTQMTAMMNILDGYYYVIPKKWLGNIAILKDTDNHLREIYAYNQEDAVTGERLIYFKTVSKKDWDSGKYSAHGVSEIMNNGDISFICWISETALTAGITIENVKTNFKLIE